MQLILNNDTTVLLDEKKRKKRKLLNDLKRSLYLISFLVYIRSTLKRTLLMPGPKQKLFSPFVDTKFLTESRIFILFLISWSFQPGGCLWSWKYFWNTFSVVQTSQEFLFLLTFGKEAGVIFLENVDPGENMGAPIPSNSFIWNILGFFFFIIITMLGWCCNCAVFWMRLKVQCSVRMDKVD